MALSTALCKGEIVRLCSITGNLRQVKQVLSKYPGTINVVPTFTTLAEWKRYSKFKLDDIQCGYLKVPNGSIIRKFYNSINEYIHSIVVSDPTDNTILYTTVECCSNPGDAV